MNNDNPVADPAEDVAVGNETSEEALIRMNNENPVADPAEDAAVVDETSLVAQINNILLGWSSLERRGAHMTTFGRGFLPTTIRRLNRTIPTCQTS